MRPVNRHWAPLLALLAVPGVLGSSRSLQQICLSPGCTQCETWYSVTCKKCSAGYQMLASQTCGCAKGYGSYATPQVGSLPYAPPRCLVQLAALRPAGRSDGSGLCICFKCPDGYVGAGGPITSAVCVSRVKCPGAPPAGANARNFNGGCRDGITGRRCSAGCKPGYSGSATATCTASSGWSVSSTCTPTAPQSCAGLPAPIPGGTWPGVCANSSIGTLCAAECTADPLFQGSVQSVCASGGTWSAPVGSCYPPRCTGLPPSIPNAAWPRSCLNVSVAAVCTGRCAEGFGGAPSAQCTAAGTWAAGNGSCELKTCDEAPPPVANATWSAGCAGQEVGAVCNASCSAGLQGGWTSSCTTAATWSPPAGACVIKRCASLPSSVDNAAWPSPCRNSTYGSTCAARCSKGYSGSFTATCTENGWSEPAGNCLLNTCTVAPPPLENASWAAGCVGTGAFSSCAGACDVGFTGNVSARCSAVASWSVAGNCTINRCTSLPAGVDNAMWARGCRNSPYGSVCAASCEAGYLGDVSATCGADGRWREPAGECVLRTCSGLPPPVTDPTSGANASWVPSCADAPAFSMCSASCDADTYTGGWTSDCDADGSWTAPVGACTLKTCIGLPPSVANVAWASGCANAPAGFTCLADCVNGVSGTYSSSCGVDAATGAAVWSAPAGSCV